jgi:WhiB family transcriptional regulator, redox-sensing transcriptional regulator
LARVNNLIDAMTARQRERQPGFLDGIELPPSFPSALCAQADPEFWFPLASHPGGRNLKAEGRAVKLCYDCPHMIACGDYAVSQRIEYGVWGGLTESDRQTIWDQDEQEKAS